MNANLAAGIRKPIDCDGANTSYGPQNSLKFDYDAKGRRIRRQVWPNKTWSNSPTNDVKFLYDGWNLTAELNALSSNARVRTYTWGTDLSGTMQGAGGVGGLLGVVYYGAATTNCFVAFDGNGNVATLINGNDGKTVCQYEYGPFGENIRSTGPMAKCNPFRFSTKYQDDESDLVYYGYRFYNGSMGRWLSRDLIDENGGENLFGFVVNSPVNFTDKLGLLVIQKKSRIVHVGKCEIVVLYGHAWVPGHWRWKTPYSESAGAALMCWPESNSAGLGDDLMNSVIKGSATQDRDVEVDWGIDANVHDQEGIIPSGFTKNLWNANYLMQQLETVALQKAKAFCACAKCNCKRIDVRFVRIEAHGEIQVDPTPPKKPNRQPGIPYVKSYTYDCKTGKSTDYVQPPGEIPPLVNQ